MKSYLVNNDNYFTICSIHYRVLNIFENIQKINPSEYKTPEDLYQKILEDIKYGNDFINVALEMGQNMENAIRFHKSIYYGSVNTNIYNYNYYLNNEEIPED
jgi:hypothetical protein